MTPTIDTAFSGGLAVKITPFKAIFNDVKNVTHLQVNATNDNLMDKCQLFWQVLDDDKSKRVSGVENLSGADYIAYKADRMVVFEFVANKLGLTFI